MNWSQEKALLNKNIIIIVIKKRKLPNKIAKPLQTTQTAA